MKVIISIILWICIVFGVFSLVANVTDFEFPWADEEKAEENVEQGTELHIHSYGPYFEREATCTKKGFRTLLCECGISKSEYTPALGHSFENGACTRCGTAE